MNTSLLSALLLLGLSSAGMALDWEVDNMDIFKTNIPDYCMDKLGSMKAAAFRAGIAGCPAAPSLQQANWLLDNINNPTCAMFTKFNQLLVQNQLCLADVCQTVSSNANIIPARLEWIFDNTELEDMLDDTLDEADECADEAAVFMANKGSDIVAAWQNGAGVCDMAVLDGAAISKIVKRVVISNCVKRAFVNACQA